MPIKGLSENVRLPRLGKIHLGIKAKNASGAEYPQKTDYFVFPKEHPDYDKVVEMYGEKPKSLDILIPVEDEELWATQYYRAYSRTYGLICRGDGETATRLVDTATKQMPDPNKTKTTAILEFECKGRDCPAYKAKRCHEVMNLRFMLYKIPGLGIWQIDTGSINSILNINSSAEIIKGTLKRIAMVPLTLTLDPVNVNNPEDGKKQTVFVLNLRTKETLAELASRTNEIDKLLKLDAPLETTYQLEVQTEIDELWPDSEIHPATEDIGLDAEQEELL